MNYTKLSLLAALLGAASITATQDPALRGSRVQQSENQTERTTFINPSESYLFKLPKLDDSTKNLAFALGKVCFIKVDSNNMVVTSQDTNSSAIEATTFAFDEQGLLPATYKTYTPDARKVTETVFNGNDGIQDNISRAFGVSRAASAYKGITPENMFAQSTPLFIHAKSAKEFAKFREFMVRELDAAGVDIHARPTQFRPVAVVSVANDPFLVTLSEQDREFLSTYYNVTSPLDPEIRSFFAAARANVVDHIASLSGSEKVDAERSLGHEAYAKVEGAVNGFSPTKIAKTVLKEVFDKRTIALLISGIIISAYLPGNLSTMIGTKLPGSEQAQNFWKNLGNADGKTAPKGAA